MSIQYVFYDFRNCRKSVIKLKIVIRTYIALKSSFFYSFTTYGSFEMSQSTFTTSLIRRNFMNPYTTVFRQKATLWWSWNWYMIDCASTVGVILDDDYVLLLVNQVCYKFWSYLYAHTCWIVSDVIIMD